MWSKAPTLFGFFEGFDITLDARRVAACEFFVSLGLELRLLLLELFLLFGFLCSLHRIEIFLFRHDAKLADEKMRTVREG